MVHQYEGSNIERCHVLLLNKYLSKLPVEMKKKDIFYCKPKASAPTDPTAPWYCSVPVGRNTLLSMMKTMASKAGIDRKVSNHSLRAYGVTKLFKENIPEKVIMDGSGHRSIEGVRHYTWVVIRQ